MCGVIVAPLASLVPFLKNSNNGGKMDTIGYNFDSKGR